MTKEQNEKDSFEVIAEELECDTSDDALDKAFDGLDLKAEKEEETTDKSD